MSRSKNHDPLADAIAGLTSEPTLDHFGKGEINHVIESFGRIDDGGAMTTPVTYGELNDPLAPPFVKLPRSDHETTKPSRSRLLDEANQIITGDRNVSYGSPTENFQNTADMWTVQFGHMLKPGMKFTPPMVAQAMILLKAARMIAQPKRDNYLDIAGYAACGWECEEDAANDDAQS